MRCAGKLDDFFGEMRRRFEGTNLVDKEGY
jgi:hypothetical protein